MSDAPYSREEIQALADELNKHAETCKPCKREMEMLARRFQDVVDDRMCPEIAEKLRRFVKAVALFSNDQKE